MTTTEIACLAGAYLLGSIPFGLLAGRLKGIDIRQHGSGNIGATNVLRVAGKPIGICVFVLDFLKGFAPAFLAERFLGAENLAVVLIALASILGHNFPVWLGFKGGKGIATSGGALFALTPVAALIGVATWVAVYFSTRYVAVASMLAAAAIPVAVFAFERLENKPLLVFAVFVALMAIWRHRTNIRRLLDGTEHRFNKDKADPEVAKSLAGDKAERGEGGGA